MGVLWISVLFISFGQLCVMQEINSKTTGSTITVTTSPKPIGQVTDIKIKNEQIDTNIQFDVEWKSNHTEIYSYLVQLCISINLNINNTSANKCYNKVAVKHENYKSEYSASIDSKYVPAATYRLSIEWCSEKSNCTQTLSVLECSTVCKLPKTINHHTPSRQPILNLKNITCKHLECEIDMNITNIQTSNSSLYGFQMKKETPISRGFVKQLRDKGNNSNLIIPWNDPGNIITTFGKIDVCNNKTILLLVNDYMGLLNYTIKDLTNFRESANCELFNRSLPTTVNNYYYLIIIPIVLILIGIIAFIKRKSLFKVWKKITSNRHEMTMEPATIIPLVRKNSMKILQKFNNRCPSHVLTPEGLQLYFQGNPEKIINNLKTEFKNVGEDTSQKTIGESFEDQNRYKNILPYEETSVKLNFLENKFNSHYINASYIKGYNNDRKYIATQGPTVKTLGDFWRMVWQEKITLIIMLTNTKENGRKKCEQYWPDKGVKSYENYTVTFQSVNKYFEYTKREFTLAHMNLERNVTQLHFTIWPDRDIPQTPYSLVKFLKAARDYKNIGPILVHCSAGIGRTGTFILCDYIIDMLDESGKADFPQALNTMRKCRKNLVQYIAQYLYSHCVINEYLHTNLLDINKNKFNENNVSEATIEETLRNIQNSDYWLNILHPATIHHGYDQNREKHRINAPQPLNSTGFISLHRYPNHNKESYYIEAVEISSEARTIINSAQPLPNTLGAFWRLILEKNISLILSLQELDADDETSIQFWPTPEETLNPVDYITLTLIELSTHGAFDCISIKLEDSKNDLTKYVSIVHFKNWQRNSLPEIDEFLLYYKVFAEFPRKEPILIACYDAADASSVFITFLYLLDLLKWNLTIDVNTAISTLKIYRKSFNLDTVKLKFIYDVMRAFLQNLNEDFYEDTEAAYENLKLE